MAKQAIGMIETKGLTALVVAADTMLKSAAIQFMGWKKVGSGLCSCYVTGDVAMVKASMDAGISAAKEVGEVVCSQVLSHPHEEINRMMPK